jgi:hypothetical protein
MDDHIWLDPPFCESILDGRVVHEHLNDEGEEVESSESCCESFVISGESAEMGSPGPT